MRVQRSAFSRFLNRDDISDDIDKLNGDIRDACALFLVGFKTPMPFAEAHSTIKIGDWYH